MKTIKACLLILYLASYFVSSASTHNPQEFLSFLQAETSETSSRYEPKTSLGKLADGVEKVNENLSDLSVQLDSAIKSTNNQLDSTITMNAQLSASLIDGEISDLENELFWINHDIDELEEELEKYKKDCDEYTSCSACTAFTSCVWCSSEQLCVDGDSSGPDKEECESFEYGECINDACDGYTSCASCLLDSNCGWCQNGYYCLVGTGEDTGSCHPSFYYHADSESQSECPVQSSSSGDSTSYYSSEDDESEKIQDLESKINDLKKDKAVKETKIEALEDEKEEILDNAQAGLDTEPEDIYVENNLDGLAQDVDMLYEAEVEDEKDYQEALWDAATETVTDETSEIIQNRTDTVNDEIDKYEDDILQSLEDADEHLTEEINELSQSVDNLGNTIDEALDLADEVDYSKDEDAEEDTAETSTEEDTADSEEETGASSVSAKDSSEEEEEEEETESTESSESTESEEEEEEVDSTSETEENEMETSDTSASETSSEEDSQSTEDSQDESLAEESSEESA